MKKKERIKKFTEEEIRDKMTELFKKELVERIDKELNKEEDIFYINGHKYIKFIEISEFGRRPEVYINVDRIVNIFNTGGEVSIRIDTPEYFIYKVEGSIEEVLKKVTD